MAMTEAEKKSQKKYNQKSKYIQLKFTDNQMSDHDRIRKYCTDNNLSLQGYIKTLVKKDLDEKKIPYPTQD